MYDLWTDKILDLGCHAFWFLESSWKIPPPGMSNSQHSELPTVFSPQKRPDKFHQKIPPWQCSALITSVPRLTFCHQDFATWRSASTCGMDRRNDPSHHFTKNQLTIFLIEL